MRVRSTEPRIATDRRGIMVYRMMLAACLVLPLCSLAYSYMVMPVLSGVMLISLSQFLLYAVLVVNAWLCRRSIVGTRILIGSVVVLSALTFGLMFVISSASYYAAAILVYAILSAQLMVAFAAAYVSCIYAENHNA